MTVYFLSCVFICCSWPQHSAWNSPTEHASLYCVFLFLSVGQRPAAVQRCVDWWSRPGANWVFEPSVWLCNCFSLPNFAVLSAYTVIYSLFQYYWHKSLCNCLCQRIWHVLGHRHSLLRWHHCVVFDLKYYKRRQNADAHYCPYFLTLSLVSAYCCVCVWTSAYVLVL